MAWAWGLGLASLWLRLDLSDDVERRQAAPPRRECRRVRLRVQLAQQHRTSDGLAVGNLQLRATVRVHVVLVDVGEDQHDVDVRERQLAQRLNGHRHRQSGVADLWHAPGHKP